MVAVTRAQVNRNSAEEAMPTISISLLSESWQAYWPYSVPAMEESELPKPSE